MKALDLYSGMGCWSLGLGLYGMPALSPVNETPEEGESHPPK